MKLKRVSNIRDEYFDNNETLSPQSLDELRQHLESKDEDELCRAISLVTDARLMQFVPLMAKHLNHEDSYVRESLIGKLLGILKLSEYAEIGLKMAKEDPKSGPRALAVSNLGAIINKVDKKLQKEIAEHIYHVVIDTTYSKVTRKLAYKSAIKAMGNPPNITHKLELHYMTGEILEKELLTQFCKKYGVKMES
jgi:hypothetical protein